MVVSHFKVLVGVTTGRVQCKFFNKSNTPKSIALEKEINMSDTVHYRGKLTLVSLGLNLEDTCKEILLDLGIEYSLEIYASPGEALEDKAESDFVIINGSVYRNEFEELGPDDDIHSATLNEDGSISYEVRYYNGGCGFVEALEDSINKLNL